MSKANALLSKLKSSLPKPTPTPPVRSQHTTAVRERSVYASPAKAMPEVRADAGDTNDEGDPGKGKRVPLCFSVYEWDVQRLDEIKDFMRSKGYRNVTNSEAVRLACRAVEIGEHFVSVYQQMRREDGRRK
jgi:hypothetical protein